MESSKELRALSRINEQKIKKMKMMVLEEKKRRKQEIKENMERSRMTVENFHLQKYPIFLPQKIVFEGTERKREREGEKTYIIVGEKYNKFGKLEK